MSPARVKALVLLCGPFLAGVLWVGVAPAGSVADGVAALQNGRLALEEGDDGRALNSFEHAASELAGTDQHADRLAALAGIGRLKAARGDVRGALLAWTTALPLADGLAAGGDPDNAELGVFARLQLAELLRPDDPVAAEQFAWDAVREAAGTGLVAAAAAPVCAVLEASQDEAGVRERLVELDELLAPMEGYRLHHLPRPQPLGWLVHDVARQYAEAGALEGARSRFGLAVRVWLALDAEDLAARALVDLGRAAMELGDLPLAGDALKGAEALSAEDARLSALHEVSAMWRARSGDAVGARRIWGRLADGAVIGTPRHASLLAQDALLAGGAAAVKLHEGAAAVFRAADEPALALHQLISAADRAARPGGSTVALRRLLEHVGAELAADAPPTVAQRTEAMRQLAMAELALRDGRPELARSSLAAGGAAYFRVGATDAVAYAVGRYVDAAIAEGDLEAADVAVHNVIAVERDLGLGLDGWRALASRARLHTALGDVDAAASVWAVAAGQVERLASLGQLTSTEGIPGPVEAVYAPWVELLLGDGSAGQAFSVAQRAASLRRGLLLDGRIPGSALERDFARLRREVGPLRDALARVSTRAGAADPAELRAPLLERLEDLQARWAKSARLEGERMPRGARRELVSTCTVAEVGERLGPGVVLHDEHGLGGGTVAFVVDAEGVLVLRPGDPKGHPARRKLERATHVVSVGATELPVRLSAAVPVTRALLACDLLDAVLPTGAEEVHGPLAGPPRAIAGDLATRALRGARPTPPAPADGLVVHVDEGEPTRVVLDRFGEGGVLWVAPTDRAAVLAALAKASSLDDLLRRLRRARVSVSVWLSPPALRSGRDEPPAPGPG